MVRLILLIFLYLSLTASTLSVWGRDGTQKQSVTFTGSRGRLEYHGGGLYDVNHGRSWARFRFDGTSVTYVQTVTNWGRDSGQAICNTHAGSPHPHWNHNFVYALAINQEECNGFCLSNERLAAYTIDGDRLTNFISVFSGSSNGCASDGRLIYWAITTSSLPNTHRIRSYQINQGGLEQIQNKNHGLANVEDITFDGKYFYFLTTTQIRQYNFAKNVFMRQWSHGLTTPKGITFNGNDLIVMSN